MRCELPILRRCCFCVPLRRGLLVWAYLKQVFSLFLLTFLILEIRGHTFHVFGENKIPVSLIMLTILDILYHLLFIISAHSKGYWRMMIFYRYSVTILCLYIFGFAGYIGLAVKNILSGRVVSLNDYVQLLLVPTLLTIISLICLQVYLVLLVRSEYLKLKNNSRFEFVLSHTPDNKHTADDNFVKRAPDAVYLKIPK